MTNNTTNGQLDLFNHTDNSLEQYLEERLNRPIALTLTENSTSMLSAQVRTNILRIRLHKMFLSSGVPVIEELVSYLKQEKRTMPLFRKFARENRGQLRLKSPNTVTVTTKGTFHDLRELYDEINETYFKGMISAAITWGAGNQRRSVRKRTLGSYSERSQTIRINPILDKKSVPRYYVAFVVYHEMLHAAMGMPRTGARRSIHSPEFRRRERLYRDYERAIALERGEQAAGLNASLRPPIG